MLALADFLLAKILLPNVKWFLPIQLSRNSSGKLETMSYPKAVQKSSLKTSVIYTMEKKSAVLRKIRLLLCLRNNFWILNVSFCLKIIALQEPFLIAIFSKSFIFDRDKWIIRERFEVPGFANRPISARKSPFLIPKLSECFENLVQEK